MKKIPKFLYWSNTNKKEYDLKIARDLAAAIGLELEPNETYVQPFFRQAWVLKDKMDTNRQ